MSFIKTLDRFCDYVEVSRPSIKDAVISVTERHARNTLKIKKKDPLVYRGLTLKCIGSQRWRNDHQQQ